jgi:tripartite-type tricarboxylate transporter receptor subunit TctC
MKKQQHTFLGQILAALFVMVLVTNIAPDLTYAAEKYPDRPIRIIVPWSLGGSTDLLARCIQPYLKEVMDAPTVVVENKPGGMTLVGLGAFSKEKADGYTLLVDDVASMTTAYLWGDKPGFDWEDFVPLVIVILDPRYFFVRKDSPYKDVNDLVQDARKRPKEVSVAVPAGSGAHWLITYIAKKMDLPISIVGYPGGGPATAALLGGHVNVYFSEGMGRVPVREKLRAIGVTIPERGSIFPEAPPCVEQPVFKERGVTSLPGYEVALNTGVWVHKDVKDKHPDIFEKLVEAVSKVKDHPGFQERAKALNIDKVAVWWPHEKAIQLRDNSLRIFKENMWIIEEMRGKK